MGIFIRLNIIGDIYAARLKIGALGSFSANVGQCRSLEWDSQSNNNSRVVLDYGDLNSLEVHFCKSQNRTKH